MKFWRKAMLPLFALCLALGESAWLGVSSASAHVPFLHRSMALVTPASNKTSAHKATAPVEAVATQAVSPLPASSVTAESVPSDVAEGDDEANTLPAVSTMMGTAAETLKSINSQASILQARIAQAQMESEAKMARQKAVFERRLQQQEQTNKDVVSANKHISEEIVKLKAGNQAIRKHTDELVKTNNMMRIEMRTLQAKLQRAGEFITTSLQATDDRNAKQLAVLEHGAKTSSASFDKHDEVATNTDSKALGTVDDDDEDDEDDSEASLAGASLLAVAATTRRTKGAAAMATESSESAMGQLSDVEAELTNLNLYGPAPQAPANPNDLLTVLSSSVATLKQQELAGETKLKSMFLSNFKAGTKRHKSLLQAQQGLNATRDSLQSLQTKLKTAEAHLDVTHEKIERRMRGFGLFLQRLAHVALAPTREAPRLLDALPTAVVAEDVPAVHAMA